MGGLVRREPQYPRRLRARRVGHASSRRGAERRPSGRGCRRVFQRGEIVARQTQLLLGRLGAIDDGAERRVLGPILRVPRQVLARDAHAGTLAVELVQRPHVREQRVAHDSDGRRWQQLARREEMRDLAEDPRPPLRGAADHQRVGARGREHGARLLAAT